MGRSSNRYRFLFINPPYERLKGLSLESIPLGLLYVATVLDRRGYEAVVYDADTDFYRGNIKYDNISRAMKQTEYIGNLENENHPAWIETINVLEKYRPDFVGVTMITPVYSSCQKILKLVKQRYPYATLIVGGPHVTICKDEVLRDNREVDFAFVGEAEESIIEFIEAFSSNRKFSEIKGLIYRDKDKITFTGDRPRIQNLDRLPIPNRRLLHFIDKYHKRALALMVASRGCPFSCAFCASVPLWKKLVKLRSPENVLKEVDYLVEEYGIRSFRFWDDTFTSNKRALINFCKLIENKYGSKKFRWECLTNVNCIDPEVLYHLKKSGCVVMEIGVESGSDKILRMIKKNITTSQVREVAKLIKKTGFWLHTFFMVGIPYESEEDIRRTIDFMKEIEPDSVNLCTFTPYPGTELYDYAVEKSMFKKTSDYGIYDTIGHHSNKNFFTENISKEKYLQLLEEVLTLSTSISRRLTLRKLILKRHAITPERIKHKMRTLLRSGIFTRHV